MKTMILLVDESEESEKAREILVKQQVPFDELPAHQVWKDVEYPMPALFTEEDVYKGLIEIQILIEELGYGQPN